MTLPSMFEEVLVRHPERPALSYPVGRGGRTVRDWRMLTWHEVGQLVVDVAERLPLTVGDGRTIAVLADTDARYPVLELAVGLAGRTVQPLYVSATDDELRAALAITGAEVLVVGQSQSARAHAGRLHARIVELGRASCRERVSDTV